MHDDAPALGQFSNYGLYMSHMRLILVCDEACEFSFIYLFMFAVHLYDKVKWVADFTTTVPWMRLAGRQAGSGLVWVVIG